jgi:hypothetical protein
MTRGDGGKKNGGGKAEGETPANRMLHRCDRFGQHFFPTAACNAVVVNHRIQILHAGRSGSMRG